MATLPNIETWGLAFRLALNYIQVGVVSFLPRFVTLRDGLPAQKRIGSQRSISPHTVNNLLVNSLRLNLLLSSNMHRIF